MQSVDHAVNVLQALQDSPHGIGLTDVAATVGLSKATVHHLLATLEARRLVARDPETTRYRLSWGLYELGAAVVRSVDLTRTARPYLDRLAERTGESVLLGILDEESVLYLDRGDAPSAFRMVANAGRRSPLHSTASGKVLLAFPPGANLLTSLLAHPLARLTPATIVDPAQLRGQLADIRRRGYGTCWEEREAGLCSVAVPIRDYSGAVIASLAIAGPATRLNPGAVSALLPALQSAGRTIGAHLGHGEIEE